MDWLTLINNYPQLLDALITTLELLFCALGIGIVLALIFAFILEEKSLKIIHYPIHLFTYIIRGTPLLVQIFIIYFGAPSLTWVHDSFLWSALKHPFICAFIALGLNTAAYTTILFRGAVQAIPHNEKVACLASGMSSFQAYVFILLPQAIRLVLPAYSNEVIMVLKGTSLASAITVMELTGMTQSIIGQTYMTMEFLTVAAILYLLINWTLMGIFKMLIRSTKIKITSN